MTSTKPVSGPAEYDPVASAEEILDDARNGKMFILMGAGDRANEGDLVIPGQMATPEAINFMVRYGRGLICLCLTRSRTEQLALQPMCRRNGPLHQTAFTVSIEARDRVTTGISAADRARTIAVAIDAANGPDSIVTPGHVFPLTAQEGGVLVRAGRAEAAVDVARLAGLNETSVICEVMNERGVLARRDDLIAFAKHHGLRIGTIGDLAAYRRQCDRVVERISQSTLHSDYGGEWRVIAHRNRIDGRLSTVLQKGQVFHDRPTLVRVHGVSVLDDMLGRPGSRRRLLQGAMKEISASGSGLIVLLGSN